jgi:tetratricopeptide (TPR) repeat protein
MYLKGSSWSMNKRRRSFRPWRILVLLVLIGGLIYVERVVIPVIPPLFISTATPTRDPETFITEARNFVAEGRYAQAVEAYNLAIQATQDNPAPFIEMARIQIYMGDYTEAVTNAELALVISSNNSIAYALRGWAQGLNGDYLGGIGSLEQAIALDPNNSVAYAYLAEVLVLQKQSGGGDLETIDNAIEYSRKAESLAPDTLETLRARGFILQDTGNDLEALDKFKAAVEINPYIFDLHLALGLSYRFTGDNVNAIAEFQKAIALNPTNPLAYTYTARTYASDGNYPGAIQYARDAVKYAPEDPYMHGNYGVMFFRNKQYLDAEKELRLAVQGGITSDGVEVRGLPLDYGRIAEYYSSFGLVLARLNQCSEAIQISSMIQNNLGNDQIAVDNAIVMVEICKENIQNPPLIPTTQTTLTPTLTLTPVVTLTPKP